MSRTTYTADQIDGAREALLTAAKLWLAVNVPDAPITDVEIPDSDCVRFLTEIDNGVRLDIKSYLLD